MSLLEGLPEGPKHNPSWKTMARLLRVIELLSSRKGSNTQEIAAAIGLGNERDVTRTILPALRELGLRIEEPDAGSPGISHRYWLDRELSHSLKIGVPKSEVVLLRPLLEADEWMLLSFLLGSGGRLTERPEIQATLQRLRSKLAQVLADSSLGQPEPAFSALLNRLDPVFEYLDKAGKHYPDELWDQVIQPLVAATASQKLCRVIYHSFHAEAVKTMEIMPLRLVEHGGGLYLLAMSAKHRNTVMPLELGRFRAVEVLEEGFELPDIDLDAILASSFNLFIDQARHYVIRFSPQAAAHIRERQWAPEQRLSDLEDGWLLLEMESSGYPDILHWVLSWGPQAEVLEPQTMRDELRRSLQQSLAHYRE